MKLTRSDLRSLIKEFMIRTRTATINEEIGRNYKTLDNDPYTNEDYADVEIDTWPITTSDRWGASVTCLSDPSLSTPERQFEDEQSAKHWARMQAEDIYRKTLNTKK